MIISTNSDTMNTMAQMMVMRSKFFSMMLVPVCVEYIELAMASEMPVPLPECMRMKMTRPTPESTSSIRKSITNGVKSSRFLHSDTSSVRKTEIIPIASSTSKQHIAGHLVWRLQADGCEQRGRDVGELAILAG